MFKPTPHPVLRLPTAEQAMALGAAEFERLFGRGGLRERTIAEERFDPLQHGWEPPVWKVCDCLLGFPWVDKALAERVRAKLGFSKPIDILLINGGQRGAKTTYGIKRGMKMLCRTPKSNAWFFHSNLKMSIKWHMEIVWQFMPPHLRKNIKSQTTYLAYKKQTGFSDEKFILDNLSTGEFRTYEQDPSTIEGANLDYIFCDELVPPNVVQTLQLRIAERQGKMVIGFTPVDGYTETVRMFQDGAEVKRESLAHLCPRDGGPPDLGGALGLVAAELAELAKAEEEGRASWAPACEPESFSDLWENPNADFRDPAQ